MQSEEEVHVILSSSSSSSANGPINTCSKLHYYEATAIFNSWITPLYRLRTLQSINQQKPESDLADI